MITRAPVRFSVDYPDRELDRLTTGLRVLTVIPIGSVLASIGGFTAGLGQASPCDDDRRRRNRAPVAPHALDAGVLVTDE